jgi:tetratricopeptide (TPR) repeat protein
MELPELVPVDEVDLEERSWHRSEPVLPLPASGGATDAFIMGSKEAEVAEATDPEVPLAYARLAYGSATRFMEADRVLAAAIARFPAHAPLYVLRGQAETRRRQWDDAAASFTKAIELDPTLPGGYAGRARLHRLRGRLRAALADTDAGLAVAPDDPEILIEHVHLYVAAGRAGDARGFAERATKGAPSDPDAWIALADTSADDAALEHLAHAVRLDSDSGQAWKRLCVIGARLGRAEVEHDCYEARRNGGAYDPAIVIAESVRHEKAGDLAGALQTLQVSNRSQDSLEILHRTIEIADRAGDEFGSHFARYSACQIGDQQYCDAGP